MVFHISGNIFYTSDYRLGGLECVVLSFMIYPKAPNLLA